MKCMAVISPAPINAHGLQPIELPDRDLLNHEIRIRISACAVCRTDLHIAEGDIVAPHYPIVPGHQAVGVVEALGRTVTRWRVGDRVGVPWLHATCGQCRFCLTERENLCEQIQLTGYHVHGGYAETMIAAEDAAYAVPASLTDVSAAPLLCGGVIGYRALRLAGVREGSRIGMYGFGGSAHIAAQIARQIGCEVYVFTRGAHHRKLAESLGAAWVGRAEDTPPHPLDGSVMFAPAGPLVPVALRHLDRGGTLVLAGIHMSPIPELPYALLYEERSVRTVANSTRRDVEELLAMVASTEVHPMVEVIDLQSLNRTLTTLKEGGVHGTAVVRMAT